MFVPARLIAVAACSLPLASCGHFVDANLVGAWRAEDKSSIREIAFRRDHGFSTYYRYKPAPDELAALTNPSLLECTGEWQLRGDRLSMIFKETNGAQLPSSARLVVVKVGTKDLVMKRNRVVNEKEFDYFGHALSFTRLNIPTCAQALSSSDPTVIGNDIIGNWQVHYRTHDCRYLYHADHSLEIFIDGEGIDDPIFIGTWRAARRNLVQDLKSPHSPDAGRQEWAIKGMRHDCFVINDGHSEYTFAPIKQ